MKDLIARAKLQLKLQKLIWQFRILIYPNFDLVTKCFYVTVHLHMKKTLAS